MSILDWVLICSLKFGLQLFQALEVYYIFTVEVTIMSGGILADDMGQGKVRYFPYLLLLNKIYRLHIIWINLSLADNCPLYITIITL